MKKRAPVSRLSLAARLFARARLAGARRIVLPESFEPRVLRAAARAEALKIARCVLLGDEGEIRRHARDCGIELPSTIEFVRPRAADYTPLYRRLRAKENLSAKQARADFADPLVAGCLLVAAGDADGMVAGAARATAEVLRPALRIVGLRADAKIASSFFAMDFPRPKLFADCALNIAPAPGATGANRFANRGQRARFGDQPAGRVFEFRQRRFGARAANRPDSTRARDGA